MKGILLKTILIVGLAAFSGAIWVAQIAAATEVTVYKSPVCGCCDAWMAHLEKNGFKVRERNVENPVSYKTRYGVTPELASCHTALVDGYVIEGHVPAREIRRLLKVPAGVVGLAVPGMPSGSPGMEGGRKDPYNVLSFDRQGNVKVFARY